MAGLALAFCKCADVGWQKSGWEKNKFWVGKGFLIIHFICVLVVLYDLTQSWSSIAGNGPRIGDSGGLESQNFQSYTKLSNSLLLFSKFMKKGNIKGCCDKKRRNFQFLP